MTELELIKTVRRMILEVPVRIPLAEFTHAYDRHRSVQRQTPRFAALRASLQDDAEAVLMAVQLSRDQQFFMPLWTTLVERLADTLGDDEEAQAIAATLAGPVGTMQRVLQAQGFRQVASWPMLIAMARAGRIHAETTDFPLTEAVDVYAKLKAGQIVGRAVLIP